MQYNVTRRATISLAIVAMLIALTGASLQSQATQVDAASFLVTLPNTTTPAISTAQVVGPLATNTPLTLTIALPSRDPSGLDRFTQDVSDPSSSLYHHFLTTEQFNATFGADRSLVQKVEQFIRNAGLQLVGEQSGGLYINVTGTAGPVASAFHVSFNRYQGTDGQQFYANDQPITVPAELASSILTVSGLNNAPLYHHAPMGISQAQQDTLASTSCLSGTPSQLTPAMLASAYNFPTAASGTNQHIALYELDGYNAANITAFASCFAPSVNVANVVKTRLVDLSAPMTPGSGQIEVELDAEIVLGLASGLASVDIYEAPNGSGTLDELVAIANDNKDSIVSISWGACEAVLSQGTVQAEDNSFKQMVAQGQTVFVASGDSGAYGCAPFGGSTASTLSISDFGGSPNVVTVGGTRLNVSTSATYQSESVWNHGTASSGAGGGGISKYWSAPSWQTLSGAVTGTSPMRTIPDITADADPSTGYLIYAQQGAGTTANWLLIGGTSAAAPLWAALQARANQLANARLGLITPALYNLYKADKNAHSATGVTLNGVTYYDYATQANGAVVPAGAQIAYHDVTTGNNGFGTSMPGYTAVTGFDAASGLGSMNGTVLANFLAASGSNGGTPTPTPSPTATPKPSPTATATPKPSPTATPKPSPTATATPKPSPTATATPSPSPTPITTPKVYAVARGSNNAYWISTATTTSASQQWTQLDATQFQGAPAVIDLGAASSSRLWIAGIGTDGTLRVSTYDTVKHSISSWISAPGTTCVGDAAMAFANNQLFVSCRTTQNTVLLDIGVPNASNPTSIAWSGWSSLLTGASITASPTMTTNGSTLTIIAQGSTTSSVAIDWIITYNVSNRSVQSLQYFQSSCISTPSLSYRGASTNDYAIGCIDSSSKAAWVTTISTAKGTIANWTNLGTPSGTQLKGNIAAKVNLLDNSQTAFYATVGTNGAAYLEILSGSGQVTKQWMPLSPASILLANIAIDYYNG
jgi:Pro-kumamolisin, activation domain